MRDVWQKFSRATPDNDLLAETMLYNLLQRASCNLSCSQYVWHSLHGNSNLQLAQQVVKVIWHNDASAPHMDGSVVFFRCTPYTESQKWLPWQHPLEPRNRLCIHRIAWPRKPTPRIKQRVASYHTTKVIAHRKAKSGCHGNVP